MLARYPDKLPLLVAIVTSFAVNGLVGAIVLHLVGMGDIMTTMNPIYHPTLLVALAGVGMIALLAFLAVLDFAIIGVSQIDAHTEVGIVGVVGFVLLFVGFGLQQEDITP